MDSSTGGGALSPVVHGSKVGNNEVAEFDGMVFAVTDGNEVAKVLEGGARCVLGSESYAHVKARTGGSITLSPAVHGSKVGSNEVAEFDGMVFAVTDGNEVAEVLEGGALRELGSESYADVDARTGGATRHHFVDVQGETEAMLLLVSVREDKRRIVGIRSFY